jgi:hypothetical protein
MKKINKLSFFVALVFSLFGATAQAQSFQYQSQTNWTTPGGVQKWARLMSPSIGASMYTVMRYTSTDTLRKVIYYNLGGSIPGNVNWQAWSVGPEIIFPGTNIADTVMLENGQGSVPLVPNGGNGWGVQVRFYPLTSWTPVHITTFAFGQITPTVPPVVGIQDPMNTNGCNMSGSATVQSEYFPDPGTGNNASFLQRMYASLQKPDGSVEVISWTFPLGIQPVANFSLDPFDSSGEYCVRWWITSEHLANSPKYWIGEMVVWENGYCFPFGDISTSVDGVDGYEGITVYPNPTSDGVVTVTSTEATNYKVISGNGQQVAFGQLQPGATMMMLQALAPGTYILQTESGQSVRMVKQ